MPDSPGTVVTIFDQSFRIGSASSDAEAIREAAAFLDDRMRQVAVAARRRVPLEVAIVAAMEIADEVLSERDRRDQLLSDADERISHFTRRLEGGSDSPPESDSGPAPRF